MKKDSIAFGVDFGGTSVRVGVVDGYARILGTERRLTAEIASPAAFAAWVRSCIRELSARLRIRVGDAAGLGVGVPGPVDPDRGLVYSLTNVPNWRNVRLAALLSRGTGLPVWVDNDGNAMAYGEYRFGAARKMSNAVFLTLGTGVGSGVLVGGKLLHGRAFSACEIGHMRYGSNGIRCACGSVSCIETEVGSRYLLRRLRADLDRGVRTKIRRLATGSRDGAPTLEMIAAAAATKDAYAIAFWRNVGENLGDFLGGICNLFNPEAVILGGGVMGAGKWIMDPLKRKLAVSCFPIAARTVRVLPARFGDKAGLIGAASLVWQSENHKTNG